MTAPLLVFLACLPEAGGAKGGRVVMLLLPLSGEQVETADPSSVRIT